MHKIFVLSSEILNNKINAPSFEKKFVHSPSNFLNDLDLFTKGQPFDLYKELRENAPIFFHPPMLSDPEPGYWVLTRYEDIKMVSMNPKIFSSQYSTGNLLTLGSEENRHPKLFKSTIDHMLNLDGEMHLNLRKEHMPFFKPNFISELQSKVSIKVTQLLDNAEKLVEWMEFLELAQYFTLEQIKQNEEGVTDTTPDPALIDMFNNMIEEMFDYGRFILNKKKEKPENDLLSAIANAKIDGEDLSQEFLDGSWLLIIFAGNDTTRNTMSGGIKLLHENPEQKKLVLDDFERVSGLINETVRYVSPVIHMRRTSLEETVIGEQRIGPYEKIALWYGAANRDPEIFDDPDKFNIMRSNAEKHLAFGI